MVRGWRGRAGAAALALTALAALGGCELLYLAVGQGSQPALYKLPKGRRMLVLVDVREGVVAPPTFATTLADQIGNHLWHNKAVDVPLVSQDKLIALQQANPEAYKKMGIADIARETGADIILAVQVTQLLAAATTDGTVADGKAAVSVKVVDRQGTRLWPGDVKGKNIDAGAQMGFVADRSIPEIIKKMSGQLTVRVGRMFHEYDPEDREMNQ